MWYWCFMKSPLLAALAIFLTACVSNDVDPEIESLKKENEELRQEIEKLKKKNSAISRRIRNENFDFYEENRDELVESGWWPLGEQLEIHSKTFPFRGGEFAALRLRKKRLIFGEIKSRTDDRVTLTNRPFAIGGSFMYRLAITLAKSSTVEVGGDGKENWVGYVRMEQVSDTVVDSSAEEVTLR